LRVWGVGLRSMGTDMASIVRAQSKMQQAKAARREERAAAVEEERAAKKLAASESLSVRRVCRGVVVVGGRLRSLTVACALAPRIEALRSSIDVQSACRVLIHVFHPSDELLGCVALGTVSSCTRGRCQVPYSCPYLKHLLPSLLSCHCRCCQATTRAASLVPKADIIGCKTTASNQRHITVHKGI